MVTDTEGWIAVFVGLFFWGIFTAPMKAPAVQSVQLHPIIFQLFMAFAIFPTSAIVLTFTNFEWTWEGFAGGCIWICGNLCSIYAINNCGIATAQGVWAGGICIVSFFWGWLGQPLWADSTCSFADEGLAFTGLVILILGVSLVTYFSRPTKTDGVEPSEYVLANDSAEIDAIKIKTPNRTRGILFALGTGLAAGSVLVPLKWAPGGFQSVFSFGTGVLVAAIFFYIISIFLVEDHNELAFHFREVSPYCLLSGALWNVGNISSIIATQSSLGLTVAYPTMQNAMVISGLIGIFVYKEIQGSRRIAGFGVAIVVISVGVFLLGTYASCQ